MECVGKALKFWNYQMTTEIAWQEHLAQEWTTRYTALRAKAGKVIDEANAEIGDLHNQIQALKGEKAEAEKRTADLAERYQAKVKSHNTTQELYDKLKSKVLQEDTRGAAAASAEHTLQSMNAIPRSEAFSQPVNRRTTMPELPSVRKTPHASRYPVDQNGVEQLHPFQRSGSARTSSELAAAARAMAMAPPPQPPPRAAAREPFGRISTASTPGHRVNLPRAHGNHTFPTSAHRPPGSQNYTHSIDRHVPAQERLRYHSQFQGPPDGMGHNVHARMPANRSLY